MNTVDHARIGLADVHLVKVDGADCHEHRHLLESDLSVGAGIHIMVEDPAMDCARRSVMRPASSPPNGQPWTRLGGTRLRLEPRRSLSTAEPARPSALLWLRRRICQHGHVRRCGSDIAHGSFRGSVTC
jgi:hypothetical protein